jgi:hypothetical protein
MPTIKPTIVIDVSVGDAVERLGVVFPNTDKSPYVSPSFANQNPHAS